MVLLAAKHHAQVTWRRRFDLPRVHGGATPEPSILTPRSPRFDLPRGYVTPILVMQIFDFDVEVSKQKFEGDFDAFMTSKGANFPKPLVDGQGMKLPLQEIVANWLLSTALVLFRLKDQFHYLAYYNFCCRGPCGLQIEIRSKR